MSGIARALLALGVLVITNLGTFGYATWRCRQEAEGGQRLLAEAQQKQRAAEAQNAASEQRLERLRVWGELLELQRDVNGVHVIINQLNFGNAIQAVDRIETRLRQGEYGQLFRQRAPELLPLLEQAKGALRARTRWRGRIWSSSTSGPSASWLRRRGRESCPGSAASRRSRSPRRCRRRSRDCSRR